MIKAITPPKLKKGSHVRIIAPSRSLSIIGKDDLKVSSKRLEENEYKISFGSNVEEIDDFASSSVESRLNDLHEAFADNTVDGILTIIGGYNANQLASKVDYELIKENPKVLCGFSDITALSLAIYAKTGLVTYSGPHFSSWAMQKGFEYSREYFLKCCVEDSPFVVEPSSTWSDDPWYLDQEKRGFIQNEGVWIINNIQGSFEGQVMGGHQRCLNAYQGTEFWPGLDNSLLFLEEDEEVGPELFDRQLQSLIHQEDFSGVKAIIIGRFQKNSKMTEGLLTQIIKTKPELSKIPVLANFNFGHTTPIMTFPIGGTAVVTLENETASLKIINH